MKIRTVIIDDNLNDLGRIKLKITNDLSNELEIIGEADEYEDAYRLLIDRFYNIDLAILDLTLEPGGETDPESKTGPSLLERIRKERGRIPFAVIFVTQFSELWAVNILANFSMPETMIGFVLKWTNHQNNADFVEQIRECVGRFHNKFTLIPDRRSETRERYVLNAYLENDLLSREIFISGSFINNQGKPAEEEIRIPVRRDHIQYFIVRDGYCDVKILRDDRLFKTEEDGGEIRGLLGIGQLTDEKKYPTDINNVYAYYANYFFEVGRSYFINIAHFQEHNNQPRLTDEGQMTLPAGGWAKVAETYLPIANREKRDKLLALTARWGGINH